MSSAVQFTGTSVSALYQILAEKDQPDGYVGLDSNGKIPINYLPDEIPKDFTDVEVKPNKNIANGYAGLDAGGLLNPSVIPAGAYVLQSSVGQPLGVAGLSDQSKLLEGNIPFGSIAGTVAAGNHSHSGEFVLRTEINSLNGVAGLDSSGKVAIAQIPTGTAANNVSIGNHGHAGQFEPVINPKRTAFNVDFGTSAGQAAEGNHNHDAGDITSGKLAFARLPTGQVANTVSEGDHAHPISKVTDLQFELDSKWDHTTLPYSEGTFSPYLRFFSDDSGDWVYSEQDGYYIRIKNFITIFYSVTLTSKASGGTTALEIWGLPFASNKTVYASVIFANVDLGQDLEPFCYTIGNRLRLNARSSNSMSPLGITNPSQLNDNTYFRGQISYPTL